MGKPRRSALMALTLGAVVVASSAGLGAAGLAESAAPEAEEGAGAPADALSWPLAVRYELRGPGLDGPRFDFRGASWEEWSQVGRKDGSVACLLADGDGRLLGSLPVASETCGDLVVRRDSSPAGPVYPSGHFRPYEAASGGRGPAEAEAARQDVATRLGVPAADLATLRHTRELPCPDVPGVECDSPSPVTAAEIVVSHPATGVPLLVQQQIGDAVTFALVVTDARAIETYRPHQETGS